MFCMNPVVLLTSLCGAVVLYITRGEKSASFHVFAVLTFVFLTLVNPLFNHNGKTVLFVMNDNPVTLQALYYGAASAAMLVSVLYLFASFSKIMDSDKLLCLFGSFSPKTALVLSMALRYVPLFSLQAKRVNQAQKALGMYREDNAIDSIKGGVRVFSVMVTWTLENGIITSDSMDARGYGIGRRTFYTLYRFRLRDALLLLLTLLLTAGVMVGIGSGALAFGYYPELGALPKGALSVTAYVCCAALMLLPSALEIIQRLQWKYLQSKI